MNLRNLGITTAENPPTLLESFDLSCVLSKLNLLLAKLGLRFHSPGLALDLALLRMLVQFCVAFCSIFSDLDFGSPHFAHPLP